MPFIQSLLQHKKNTGVCVNGHVYYVASDLVIRYPNGQPVNVVEADAQKLLTNVTAWALWNPEAKPAPKAVAERPRISLISSTGETIPPLPALSEGAQSAPVAEPLIDEKILEPLTPEMKDPAIPGPGEEWDDPDTAYSLDWLQACAKAYKIKYKGKDKSVLVEKIKAAMYG